MQYLVPISDFNVGNWTTAPLWSKLDETSTVAGGDGQTILSSSVSNNSYTSYAEFKITSGGLPAAGDKILRARWNGEGAKGRTIVGYLELWEGVPGTGTLIDTLASGHMDSSTGGEVENTKIVTATINDYANLYLRLYAMGSSGGPSRNLRVELIEFAIPDSVPSNNLRTVAEGQGWTTTFHDSNAYEANKNGIRIRVVHDGVQNQVRAAFTANFLSWDQSSYRAHDLTNNWNNTPQIQSMLTQIENIMSPYVGQ